MLSNLDVAKIVYLQAETNNKQLWIICFVQCVYIYLATILQNVLRPKKKKGLSHEPARISMWRRFSALVYAATVFLKGFFFFFYVIDSR